MKTIKNISAAFMVVSLFCSLSTPAMVSAKGAKLAVIVKADGPLTGLGLKEIRAIYTGEKLFEGSNKIEPLFNESSAGSFFKKVLEKTKAQYKKIWNSKAFVDGLTAPAVLPDSGDVLRAVDKDDGAIGFVDENDISSAQKQFVKIIYLADLAE